MAQRYSKAMLRSLRNDIPVTVLIEQFLKLPCKMSQGYFRFLCPICSEFVTATNPKTNLARCFRCEKNFNPIDLVMVVKNYPFQDAVEYLSGFILPR